MERSAALKPFSILVVEDDDVDAMAIERAFRRAKNTSPIHRALSGIEALEMLRGENGKTPLPAPHLLLVDINMPRMNGFDFLQELRSDEKLKPATVFVLTTSSRERDRIAAQMFNVAGYILKEELEKDFSMLMDILSAEGRRYG